MPRMAPFNGRIIFDHLPKTAGQAVNRWLRDTLGEGCVTPNLIGEHRQLIRHYGGTHSVISGHVAFENSGLDPRYLYATCVRDPIDRCLSWLYFVTNNHTVEAVPYWEAAKRFLDSGGADYDAGGFPFWPNIYVDHFAAISPSILVDEQAKLDFSLDILGEYAVIGTYDDLPGFIAGLSALLGTGAATPTLRVNATVNRPPLARAAPDLVRSIRDKNRLDEEFYRRFCELSEARARVGARVQVPRWAAPWHPVPEAAGQRVVAQPQFDLLSVTVAPQDVAKGGRVEITAAFASAADIAVPRIIIRIFNALGQCLSTTDTATANPPLGPMAPGTCEIRHALLADFPDGAHEVWMEFHDLATGQLLARGEVLGSFHVTAPQLTWVPSPLPVPSYFQLAPRDARTPYELRPGDAALAFPAPLPMILAGRPFSIPLELTNLSGQCWLPSLTRPLILRSVWTTADGHALKSEDHPITDEIAPGGLTLLDLSAIAPERAEQLFLSVALIQKTGEDGARRIADAVCPVPVRSVRNWSLDGRDHSHLLSLVGTRTGRTIVTSGTEGVLLYGPYLPLPPGRYRIEIAGRTLQAGLAWADVSHAMGTRVLAWKALGSQTGLPEGIIAVFDITIEEPDIGDLEVRIWVDAASEIAFESLTLEDQADIADLEPAGIPLRA